MVGTHVTGGAARSIPPVAPCCCQTPTQTTTRGLSYPWYWWWVTLRKTWLVVLLAVAVCVVMYIGYAAHWGWLGAVDSSTLDVLYRYGRAYPGWVSFWDVFCTVLGPTAFRLLALVVIVVALVRRQLRIALFLAISIELSGFVAEAAKALADRPRPATALVSAPSTSFPSGHAVGVMVGVLALWTVAPPR